MGCSPIKAVRELGSERRETVDKALSINLAICWNLRVSGATRRESGSDNASGADNQQGRPVLGREPSETARQTGPQGPEDTVRAAWRHAESGRNDLALEHDARE